jgi:hypothetical protein
MVTTIPSKNLFSGNSSQVTSLKSLSDRKELPFQSMIHIKNVNNKIEEKLSVVLHAGHMK